MKILPNLDFLRGCAALSVVLEHILTSYRVNHLGYVNVRWIGVVGVFLFFVHTALVLMWSLERKPHTLDFYIRRIFRIYPLAIVAIVIALLFHAPVTGAVGNYFSYAAPPRTIELVANFLLVPNLLHNHHLIVGVMWTLPYEMQMYILLPLLFFFLSRNFSRWPLLLFWGFTVALCHQLFQSDHNFFLCIPYFLPGVIAYVGFGITRAKLPAWTFPLFLATAWLLFLIRPGWRLADVLCLVVGLMLPLFHQFQQRWIIRTSHEIAKYSYSFYLMHPFAIVIGHYLMPHQPLALQLTIIITSLVVLSIASYHLLEYPMIRFGSHLANLAVKRYKQQQLEQVRIAEGEIA